MVSSAVFSAASCVRGWTAPLGAILGLAASLTEDAKVSNVEEFNKVVEKALERTKYDMTSDTKKKILEELCRMEVEPDSLSDIIKTTETYRAKYCTKKDAKEILNIFEMYFRDEISQNSHLSNLYILSSGIMSLEKLESINEILIKDEGKMDKIHAEVSVINKILMEAKKVFTDFINGISFVLIAMAVFLGVNILTEYTYDSMMIGIAPICYGVSEFLAYFLNKSGYMANKLHKKQKWHAWYVTDRMRKIHNLFYNFITIFVIPILITTACFLIVFLNMRIDKEILLFASLNLIFGNIVSVLIKNISINKNTDNKIKSQPPA